MIQNKGSDEERALIKYLWDNYIEYVLPSNDLKLNEADEQVVRVRECHSDRSRDRMSGGHGSRQ
jgi:hypothetical protein